ncbi:predicted protein, partial [Nematostella vectensis]
FQLIKSRYEAEGEKHETDEFLKPIIIDKEGQIKDGDTICFFDFRADRMRQINEAIGVKPPFETDVIPKDLYHITMTQYKKEFPFPCLFPPVVPKNVLAEWLDVQKVPQYHCAETEKYAHVTFFFNGGVEKKFDLEDRMLVPSPKVPTYDLLPPMSSQGVADEVTILEMFILDKAIGQIYQTCQKQNYTLMVTSDHGNAEQMISEQGGPHTAHTTNRG